MDPRSPRPSAAPAFGRSLVLSVGLHAAAFGAALLVAFGPARGVDARGPSALVLLAEAEAETTWDLEAPPEAPDTTVVPPALPTPDLVPVEVPLEALEQALEPDDAPLAEPLFDWGSTRVDGRPLARLEARPEVAAEPAPPSELAAAPAPRGEDRPLRLQQQGSVLLELAVDTEGRVAEVLVVESSGFERLDEAARRGVLAWRFEPALRDGVAVPETFRHRIQFELQS